MPHLDLEKSQGDNDLKQAFQAQKLGDRDVNHAVKFEEKQHKVVNK